MKTQLLNKEQKPFITADVSGDDATITIDPRQYLLAVRDLASSNSYTNIIKFSDEMVMLLDLPERFYADDEPMGTMENYISNHFENFGSDWGFPLKLKSAKRSYGDPPTVSEVINILQELPQDSRCYVRPKYYGRMEYVDEIPLFHKGIGRMEPKDKPSRVTFLV